MTPFLWLSLLAFLQALAVGAVLTPLARRLGPRLGMIDQPDAGRKNHAAPIPRSGGLAVFAAFWGCLGLNVLVAGFVIPGIEAIPEAVRQLARNIPLRLTPLAGIAVGSAMIFVLGAVDDARGLSPRVRLAVQVLATLPLVLTGTVVQAFLPLWAGIPVTILWVVLLTNSLNFLDNMNGLTSGVAAIICGVLVLQSVLAREFYMMIVFAMLAGATVGFWFFNFPRASVFLGDSGSTHLGFLLGALSIQCTFYDPGAPGGLAFLMPVVVLGVPVFDTLSVLWIRWRAGRRLMEGDTNHVSHRLVALGMSRMEAVLFLYGLTLCVGLAAVVLRPLDWRYSLVQAAVIVMLFLGLYVVERVSRRSSPPSSEAPRS